MLKKEIQNNVAHYSIRECGSTLYVGMVRVVSFSLYIGIGAKFRNRLKTAKTSLCRVKDRTAMLTLKTSDHVPLATEITSKSSIFVFFFLLAEYPPFGWVPSLSIEQVFYKC